MLKTLPQNSKTGANAAHFGRLCLNRTKATASAAAKTSAWCLSRKSLPSGSTILEGSSLQIPRGWLGNLLRPEASKRIVCPMAGRRTALGCPEKPQPECGWKRLVENPSFHSCEMASRPPFKGRTIFWANLGQFVTLSGDFLTMLVVCANFQQCLAEPLFIG